ncbi:M23 family metallopeptidase [Bacillus sp. B1-b2]|uniref:M23 family metallopeptidase n=1 Tax=Bacillus sp. B1-b2 TaxID=2653201 RepID=UPI001261B811|nr:M23 family metallopeptidase [Bacillus sp. B1-b2]KAB7671818.1 M23 family metallopeptidase [Bacillus sp. B1-b2]
MREEENKRTSPNSKVKSFFKKRWAFPAVYIGTAAIILTGVLWYQNSASDTNKFDYNADVPEQLDEPAEPVAKDLENFAWPVADEDSFITQKEFYDNAASKEEQANSLVFYNNQYQPNTGIDLKMEDDSEFEVLASLEGTVTKVSEDALLGNTIEIEHAEGIKTFYQSVKDFQVEVGEEVTKGQPIATSGKSQLNQDAGVHVHFEVRKDNVAVNPIDYFGKSLSALKSVDLNGKTSTEESSDEVETSDSSEDEMKPDNSLENETNSDQDESDSDSSTDPNA